MLIKKIITIVWTLVVFSCEIAYSQPVEYVTIEKAWSDFLENDKNIQDVKTNTDRGDYLIRYYLMQGFKEYYRGELNNAQDYIEKINFIINEKKVNVSKIPEFRTKKKDLLDMLFKQMTKNQEDKDKEVVKKKADSKVVKIAEDLESNLSAIASSLFKEFVNSSPNQNSPLPCIRPSVESEVIGTTGAKFTIKTIYCDTFIAGYSSINIAQLGMKDYYKLMSKWLIDFVIKPQCIDSLSIEKCIENLKISMEIEGHSDGFSINAPLIYQTLIDIPSGTRYEFRNSYGEDESKTLGKAIENSIRNNEELALARAWIAKREMSKLSSRVSVVAQAHDEFDRQGTYRKVVITIYAEKLFEKMFLEQKEKSMFFYKQITDEIKKLSDESGN